MRNKTFFSISVVHQFLFYAALYLILLRFGQGKDFHLMSAFSLLIPVFVTTLALPKLRHILSFAFVHLGVFLVPVLLARDSYELIFAGVVLFIMTVVHYADIKEGLLRSVGLFPGLWYCVFYGAYHLISLWRKEDLLGDFSLMAFTVSLLLFLLYRFLEGKQQFFERNRDIAELPEGQIHRVTRTIMAIFFGILLLGIGVIALSGVGKYFVSFFLFLWNLMLAGIQKLVGGAITSPVQESLEYHKHVVFSPLPQATGKLKNIPWLENLLEILMTLMVILLILGVVIGIGIFFYRIITGFSNELPEEKDTIEFLTPFVRTESAYQKEMREKTRFFDFSPNVQIRRMYRKMILSQKNHKQKLSKAFTPAELEQAVSVRSETLHHLYEKARYSKEGCDHTDVALAKQEKL